jgi:hypothetical protein
VFEEQFIELRSQEVLQYDTNWVLENANSQISKVDFKKLLD